jgi:hypothetical protein
VRPRVRVRRSRDRGFIVFGIYRGRGEDTTLREGDDGTEAVVAGRMGSRGEALIEGGGNLVMACQRRRRQGVQSSY